jgi:hypothetical protein
LSRQGSDDVNQKIPTNRYVSQKASLVRGTARGRKSRAQDDQFDDTARDAFMHAADGL